jgi:hypothetical protein
VDPSSPALPKPSLCEEELYLAETASNMVQGWRQNVVDDSISSYHSSYAATSVTAHENSYDSDKSYLEDGHDPPVEVDLTIHIPSDMIEDNHMVALVQVVPPDTDLSDIPDSWDVYDIDWMEETPDNDGEYKLSESDHYWEEDPPEEIYDEPDGGSYYLEGYNNNEPDSDSYHSDSVG